MERIPELPPAVEAVDAALIAALRTQSLASVAELYDRYGRLVFTVALRVVQDRGVAEEITQDAILRCWQTIDRYQPAQGTFLAWLLTITRNRAIDELRSRRHKHLNQLSVEELPPLPHTDPAIEETALRLEVSAALAELPPEQRRVIELIYWEGMTRNEAATSLKVPLGTVHTRLRLGMDKLRAAFALLREG